MTKQFAMPSCQMSECCSTQADSLCALTDAAAAVSVFVILDRRIRRLTLA